MFCITDESDGQQAVYHWAQVGQAWAGGNTDGDLDLHAYYAGHRQTSRPTETHTGTRNPGECLEILSVYIFKINFKVIVLVKSHKYVMISFHLLVYLG